MSGIRAGLGLVVLGCTGGDPRNVRAPLDLAPNEDTFPEEDPYFPARQIFFSAELGYDGVGVVAADVDGNANPSAVMITLATRDWDGTGSDLENYCVIALPLENAVPRDVSKVGEELDLRSARELWFGFTWDPLADPLLTTCNTPGYELDPALWGGDAVSRLTSGVEHFVAIGQQTRTVQDFLKANAPDLDLVGGALGLPPGFMVNGREPLRIDDAYAFAYRMDQDENVLVEEGGLAQIPSAELADDPFQPAFYSVSSLVFWEI